MDLTTYPNSVNHASALKRNKTGWIYVIATELVQYPAH